jgi:2-oxoisovalerate dehydrogenase E1 component alpha subunit
MTTLTQPFGTSATDDDDIVRVLRDDGTLDERTDPGLSPDEVVELYRHMVRTRLIDERLLNLQRQGRIGFHVGSLGEEAAIIGSAWAMRQGDWLFPCYREFGAALMRGLPLQRFIDNMFGNTNDVVKGRQMPDHYTCKDAHWGSISSPVGTQITQAVGFAWGAKIQKKDLATLVYFGDGATSSSEFHNGLNFAGVFKIPSLFFCRNNGWAISVPVERQTASRTFAQKGVAYGVPGVRVDGNDIFAVVAVTRKAVQRAAAGGGATLIEALTYRMGGHSTSDDPNRYRGQDDLAPWGRRDPIERIRRHVVGRGLWDDGREDQLKREVEQSFRHAVDVAEHTAPPALETMFEDVFAKPTWNLVEQRNAVLAGPRAPTPH